MTFFITSETVHHMFSARLMPLMSRLECLCKRLGVEFTVGIFIIGTGIRIRKRQMWVVDFLFAQANLAIWLTRRKRVKGGG